MSHATTETKTEAKTEALYQHPPAQGSWQCLAEGFYWLRMPLPLSLDHINLYLLEDDEGWTVIDTGMKGSASESVWRSVFEQLLGGKPVKQVIVTHMHPDHVGTAGWLCDHLKAPLLMSQAEYFHARMFSEVSRKGFHWSVRDYYDGLGLPKETIDSYEARGNGFSVVVGDLPSSYKRLRHGQTVMAGGLQWQVYTSSGHSPEHVSLFCPEKNWLLSGDQIIQRISSNVSIMAVEPEANQLTDWMAGLESMRCLPADVSIFPAHGLPFKGLHIRIDELIAHHHEQLDKIVEACTTGKTAVELLPVLFRPDLSDSDVRLAIGESVAHLNYLLAEGRLQRALDSDGYWRYTSTTV